MSLEVLKPEFAAPRPRCSSCIWFESLTKECRRNPPQIVAAGREGTVSVWPPTSAEKWCGEHKPAVTLQ